MKPCPKQQISLLLAAAMLCSLLMSCAKTDDNPNPAPQTGMDTVTTAGEETENRYDANGYLKDSIPADLHFDNEPVNILYWNNAKNVEFEAENDGSILNSAIYTRNLQVEERLGVKLNWIGEKGDYAQRAEFNQIINTDLSGSGEYDIISAYSTTIAMAVTYGYALDLLEFDEQLNFDNPWWGADLTDMATINGKLYFATGDISTNYLLRMYGTFFNKKLVEAYNLTSPYAMVENNQWTVDHFLTLASSFNGDMNGGDPIYGFVNDAITIEALFYGANLNFVEKDADDVPYLSAAWSGEKAQNLIDKVAAYCQTSSALIDAKNDESIFSSGNALFILYSLDYAMNYLSDSDVDFGIVPIPKYDTEQENYSTTLNYKYSLYMISKGTAIPEIAAWTLEALASQSYRTVTPDLYEKVMKVRYVTDETSQQMIDYIRDGVSFEIGRTFTHSFDYQTYRTIRAALAGTASSGWQSTVESYKSVFDQQLKTLIATFDE